MITSTKIPEDLLDVITYGIIENPVIAEDGLTYSKKSILDWLSRCKSNNEPTTSPITRREIGETLRPNITVQRSLDRFLKSNVAVNFSKDGGRETPSISFLGKVFEAIDPIRDIFESVEWQPPAIVVLGNEKSGKSTLLERLSMMPIFPKSKQICTRMIIQVRLRRGPPKPPLVEVYDKASGSILRNLCVPMEKGHEYVQDAMERIIMAEHNGMISGVSDNKILVLHVSSPFAPNLDLVDLPGLVSTFVRGEPENMQELTKELVEGYVRASSRNSMFLVAIPATSPTNQSLAMDIIQRLRLQSQTIGVLTKADHFSSFSESEEDRTERTEELCEKVYQRSADVVPLPAHGYVTVMNKPVRSGQFRTNYGALSHQAEREKQWFQENGLSDLIDSGNATVGALVDRLSAMYHAFIKQTWVPMAISKLAEAQETLVRENVALGYPYTVATEKKDQSRAAPGTKYHGLQFVSLQDLASIASDVAREAMGHCRALVADHIIALRLKEYQTDIRALSVSTSCPPLATIELQRATHVRLEQLTATLLEDIRVRVVLEVVSALAGDIDTKFKLSRFPRFIEEIVSVATQQCDEWCRDLEASLMDIISMSFQNIPLNPHLKVDYNFEDADGAGVKVQFTFDATALSSVLPHAVVLRLPLLLEGIAEGCVTASAAKLREWSDWIETCAEERARVVDQLIELRTAENKLMQLLKLSTKDMERYKAEGNNSPVADASISRGGDSTPVLFLEDEREERGSLDEEGTARAGVEVDEEGEGGAYVEGTVDEIISVGEAGVTEEGDPLSGTWSAVEGVVSDNDAYDEAVVSPQTDSDAHRDGTDGGAGVMASVLPVQSKTEEEDQSQVSPSQKVDTEQKKQPREEAGEDTNPEGQAVIGGETPGKGDRPLPSLPSGGTTDSRAGNVTAPSEHPHEYRAEVFPSPGGLPMESSSRPTGSLPLVPLGSTQRLVNNIPEEAGASLLSRTSSTTSLSASQSSPFPHPMSTKYYVTPSDHQRSGSSVEEGSGHVAVPTWVPHDGLAYTANGTSPLTGSITDEADHAPVVVTSWKEDFQIHSDFMVSGSKNEAARAIAEFYSKEGWSAKSVREGGHHSRHVIGRSTGTSTESGSPTVESVALEATPGHGLEDTVTSGRHSVVDIHRREVENEHARTQSFHHSAFDHNHSSPRTPPSPPPLAGPSTAPPPAPPPSRETRPYSLVEIVQNRTKDELSEGFKGMSYGMGVTANTSGQRSGIMGSNVGVQPRAVQSTYQQSKSSVSYPAPQSKSPIPFQATVDMSGLAGNSVGSYQNNKYGIPDTAIGQRPHLSGYPDQRPLQDMNTPATKMTSWRDISSSSSRLGSFSLNKNPAFSAVSGSAPSYGGAGRGTSSSAPRFPPASTPVPPSSSMYRGNPPPTPVARPASQTLTVSSSHGFLVPTSTASYHTSPTPPSSINIQQQQTSNNNGGGGFMKSNGYSYNSSRGDSSSTTAVPDKNDSSFGPDTEPEARHNRHHHGTTETGILSKDSNVVQSGGGSTHGLLSGQPKYWSSEGTGTHMLRRKDAVGAAPVVSSPQEVAVNRSTSGTKSPSPSVSRRDGSSSNEGKSTSRNNSPVKGTSAAQSASGNRSSSIKPSSSPPLSAEKSPPQKAEILAGNKTALSIPSGASGGMSASTHGFPTRAKTAPTKPVARISQSSHGFSPTSSFGFTNPLFHSASGTLRVPTPNDGGPTSKTFHSDAGGGVKSLYSRQTLQDTRPVHKPTRGDSDHSNAGNSRGISGSTE